MSSRLAQRSRHGLERTHSITCSWEVHEKTRFGLLLAAAIAGAILGFASSTARAQTVYIPEGSANSVLVSSRANPEVWVIDISSGKAVKKLQLAGIGHQMVVVR